MNPSAAIVIIGNEVLSGRTADSNINYIARRLNDVGINLREVRVVRDEQPAIVKAVNALRKEYGYVFTTGGIGPTHDDITIGAIAAAFGVAVERNLQVEEKLRTAYGNRATPATFRMADYPAGCRVVWHGEAFAPGCIMENVVVLAGSPLPMQTMFEAALPLLQQGRPLHMRQVDAWVRESQIAARLESIQAHFPEVEIGSYPYLLEDKPGTALVCRGENPKQVDAAFKQVQLMLEELGAEPRAA